MKQPNARERYIRRATLAYAAFATAWIFFSDQLLALLTDVSMITWLSTVKGLTFVMVTAMVLYVGLRQVPDRAPTHPGAAFIKAMLNHGGRSRAIPLWLIYAFAVALSIAALVVREGVAASLVDQPLLILFILPVVISALLGGLGPGLLATAICAVGVLYLGIPPLGSPGIAQPHDVFQWGVFVVVSVLLSALSEIVRRLRRRSESSHRLLETVVSGTTDAIFVKDRQGVYQLCNQAAAGFIGLPVERILGRGDSDFMSADDAARVISADRAIMARGEAQTLEERITNPLGEQLTFLSTKGPVLDAEGSVIGLFGISRDISERKRTEMMLRKNHEEMRSLVEQAPVAIAMFDRRMRFLATSRRWLEDYGRGSSQLIGLSYYEVYPDIPERWRDAHQQALAGSIVTNEEDSWPLRDGRTRWLRWAVRPWRNARGEIDGIIILAEDISKRREAEEEVRRLNVELEQRVRARTAELRHANRELDSFAGAVAHDLRAPLRAINGFSHALAEDCGDRLGSDGAASLKHIIDASLRMGEVIDGLLLLSRSSRRELRRDPLDLSAMASRILAQLARDDPGRAVRWQVQPELTAIGDARMIELVLQNLLENAWKFTVRCAHAEIRVLAERRAGVDWYCVADNGAGFDMRHAAKLFQPLQRLHRDDEFPGLGIGLASVQRIVARHGGEIGATGVPGEGARFCFSLPAPAPDSSPESGQRGQ